MPSWLQDPKSCVSPPLMPTGVRQRGSPQAAASWQEKRFAARVEARLLRRDPKHAANRSKSTRELGLEPAAQYGFALKTKLIVFDSLPLMVTSCDCSP